MPWPTDNIVTTSLDSDTDRPDRGVFLNLANLIKQVLAARNRPDGIPSLGSNGKVPDIQIGRGFASGVASLDGAGKVPIFLLPLGDRQNAGAVQLATNVEAIAGIVNNRAMTPASSKAALDDRLADSVNWAPVLAIEEDGDRRVLSVIDWIGGLGTKPQAGYIGEAGLVDQITDGVDVRGPRGPQGPQGPRDPTGSSGGGQTQK